MRLPRFAREALRPIAGRVPVPILSGVNRGLWWNLASAGSGYGSGRRATNQVRFLSGLVRQGDCVWDVGAHHGYMSLCAARRVGVGGRVYAFEPSSMNYTALRRHVRWNTLGSISCLQLALGEFDGETSFGGAGTSKTFALGGGNDRVRVQRGATLILSGRCQLPTVMKIDVEGAEAAVLRGMQEHFPSDARLVIAVHSCDAFDACCVVLNRLGFSVHPTAALRRCLHDQWRADPDLLALGPAAAAVAEEPASRAYLGN